MLAWAHFLLTELRPLYAILFATSLYAESKTLQVGIWGNKKSTCWVNQIYKNCAERCGHVWHGQRQHFPHHRDRRPSGAIFI